MVLHPPMPCSRFASTEFLVSAQCRKCNLRRLQYVVTQRLNHPAWRSIVPHQLILDRHQYSAPRARTRRGSREFFPASHSDRGRTSRGPHSTAAALRAVAIVRLRSRAVIRCQRVYEEVAVRPVRQRSLCAAVRDLNCPGEYRGRYTEANGVITFEWDGWSRAGPWGATGTLNGDSLTVQSRARPIRFGHPTEHSSRSSHRAS